MGQVWPLTIGMITCCHVRLLAVRHCQICYVEGLKDAPCLQSQGACTHVFHFSCLLKKLESKWPGARIDCQIAKASDNNNLGKHVRTAG